MVPRCSVCWVFFLNTTGGALKQKEEEAHMDYFRASAETGAHVEGAALSENNLDRSEAAQKTHPRHVSGHS